MRNFAPLLAATVALLGMTATYAPAGAIDEACRVPAELVRNTVRLEQVARARRTGQPIRIVVLGQRHRRAPASARREPLIHQAQIMPPHPTLLPRGAAGETGTGAFTRLEARRYFPFSTAAGAAC